MKTSLSLAAITLAASAACSATPQQSRVNSAELATRDIDAFVYVSDDGTGATFVETALSQNDQATGVTIAPPDALAVQHDEARTALEPSVFEMTNWLSYKAIVKTPAASAVRVVFDRGGERIETNVSIPEPFDVTIDQPRLFSRQNDEVTITWTPSTHAGDRISWSVIGDCGHADGQSTVPDLGVLRVPRGTLGGVEGVKGAGESCLVSLRMFRMRDQNGTGAFRSTKVIGAQVRELKFLTKP